VSKVDSTVAFPLNAVRIFLNNFFFYNFFFLLPIILCAQKHPLTTTYEVSTDSVVNSLLPRATSTRHGGRQVMFRS
jgi:hypothetical protein